MKGNANNVSKVELNLMGFCCIRKSIERLLCRGFKIFDNTDYPIDSCLVDQTARSINEQANVSVKLNFRRELHCALWLLSAHAGVAPVELMLVRASQCCRMFLSVGNIRVRVFGPFYEGHASVFSGTSSHS